MKNLEHTPPLPVLRDPMEKTQMMPVYVRRHRMREARDLHAMWVVAETVRYMLAKIARGKKS